MGLRPRFAFWANGQSARENRCFSGRAVVRKEGRSDMLVLLCFYTAYRPDMVQSHIEMG